MEDLIRQVNVRGSHYYYSLLYTLTSVWVLHTQNAGQNLHIQIFFLEKLKNRNKVTKLVQFLAKKIFFSLHQNAGQVFVPRFNMIAPNKRLQP